MKFARSARRVHFSRRPLGVTILALLAVSTSQIREAKAAAANQFWRVDSTSGTWTGSNWGTSGAGPFGTAWTSGNNAIFGANSTVTFATTSVANVTVADGVTVTVTAAGTLTPTAQAGGTGVSTFDIGAGSLLTWTGQSWSTTANAGFIKNGAGTWDIGAQSNALNATNGGFTLNAGTVIVGGNNSFGGANSLLTINGGTIQSSGTRAYTNNIAVGGNFTNTGTGNATFSGTVGLGSATRTITNSTTSGSRIYSGVISGTSGAGLTFDGAGAGQTYIGNAGNTFTGTISIKGSEVGFASNGALGNTANTIVLDGGRMTSATTAGAAVTATWSSSHGIQIGDTAGTSISVQSSTGDLTYDGVISDLAGKTGAWAKQGAGILRLGGSSSYNGNTAINNGTIQLTTGNDRLPTGTTVSLGQAASTNLGTLDINGRNQQIAGLNSTTGTNAGASNNTVTSVAAATLTLGGSGTYSYGDGSNANSGVITGAVSLVKQGSGTQSLGDANTYTGTTTVNGGTLLVSGALTGSITSAATVNNAGSTLGGSGTVGAVTVNSGAALQGGDGVAANGALTSAGNVTLNDGSLIKLTLDAGNTHSTLARTGGTWAFDSDQAFTFNLLGAGVGTYDNIITGLAGTETGLATIGTWVITNPDVIGSFSFDGAGGVDLVLTQVPEPSAILSLIFGTSVLASFRRFRRVASAYSVNRSGNR